MKLLETAAAVTLLLRMPISHVYWPPTLAIYRGEGGARGHRHGGRRRPMIEGRFVTCITMLAGLPASRQACTTRMCEAKAPPL